MDKVEQKGPQTALLEFQNGSYSYQNYDGSVSYPLEATPIIIIESNSGLETSDLEEDHNHVDYIASMNEDVPGGSGVIETVDGLEDEATDEELWVNKRTLPTRRKDAQARLKLIEVVRANYSLLRDKKVSRCLVWTKVAQELRKFGVRVSRDEKTWAKVFSQWRKMNQLYRNYLERIQDPSNTEYIRPPGYFKQLHELLIEAPSTISKPLTTIKRKRRLPLGGESSSSTFAESSLNIHKVPSVVKRRRRIAFAREVNPAAPTTNGNGTSRTTEDFLAHIATNLDEIREIKLQKLKLAKARQKREEDEQKRRDATREKEHAEMMTVFKGLTAAITSLRNSTHKM